MELSDVVNLIGDTFDTPDFRIQVRGYVRDPKLDQTLVEFRKEELGDIDRYLFHKPKTMYATIENFDRLYFSQRRINGNDG